MKLWQAIVIRIALTSLGLFAGLLPRRFELFFGPILGRLLLPVLKRRRDVALDNIRKCFPEISLHECEILLRKNFEHYGTLVFELLHMYSPIPNHFRRYALKNSKVHGIENWKRAHDLGKGVLFVASHIGNWELMVAGGAMAGIPLTMVTKHLKPEWLHKKMEATRLSVQVRGAYEPRPLPVIMRALRNKESVGFVMDQYAGPPIGIPVPFFGVKVGTLAAVGTLATRTGAAIITVSSHRGSDGCIHINIQPMLELSSEVLKDDVQITALLARQVEGWVRQCPEQWLWIHRRFKNVVWSERMAYTPSNASRVDT